VTQRFQDDFYAPLHTDAENFIDDPANVDFLNAINQPFVELFGRDLIGNGIQLGDSISGTDDTFVGTIDALLPFLGKLHDGGLLFGDGTIRCQPSRC
jgi:hypothetical protein